MTEKLLQCLLLMVFVSESSFSQPKKQSSNNTSAAKDSGVFDLPIKPKPCIISTEVRAAAKFSPKLQSESRAKFYGSIEKFHVTKGQVVKKGQLLATTETSSAKDNRGIYLDYVSLYKAQLRIAENNLKVALDRLQRLEVLNKKGITPQAEVDAAEREVLLAKDAKESVNRGIESMEKTALEYTKQIDEANFYAEMDGVVSQLIVDPKSLLGMLNVTPGSLIATVSQSNFYRAEAQLLDIQINKLKEGMAAQVIFPDGSTQDGKISFLGQLPYRENKQGEQNPYSYGGEDKKGTVTTYVAYIDFQRPGSILPSGLTTEVRIKTGDVSAKTCLPWNAVEIDQGAAFVNTFSEDSGWTKSPVKLGVSGQYYVEVLSNLLPSVIVKSKLW